MLGGESGPNKSDPDPAISKMAFPGARKTLRTFSGPRSTPIAACAGANAMKQSRQLGRLSAVFDVVDWPPHVGANEPHQIRAVR